VDLAAEFQRRFIPILNAERERREDAFLDAPLEIAGVDIVPFTLHQWAMLDAIRSPLLMASDAHNEQTAELLQGYLAIHPEALAQAIWVMSSEFRNCPQSARPIQWHRENFIRRLDDTFTDRAQLREASLLTIEHLRAAFADAQSGEAVAGQSFASHLAYVVHNIASHYHWAERAIIHDLPLARLWQYLRLIDKASDPESVGSNPSERQRMEIFEDVQRQARAEQQRFRELYFPPLPPLPLILN